MTDEVKITGKGIWHLIKSNLGTLVIIGGLVINALMINGKKAVDKYKSDISQDSIAKNQVEMKADIKNIQGAISLQNQAWTKFMAKDSGFKIKLYNGMILLDTAMVRHLRLTNRTEERFQFIEDQLKKNNDYYNQIPLKRQNINIASE
jgi:hypothetical protein